jgi:uncharacterized protein (DUF427 family)
VHGSRHVRVELGGEILAESSNPYLLFEPLPVRYHLPPEAAELTDRVAFFNERVELVVDGDLLERPVTPWSRK